MKCFPRKVENQKDPQMYGPESNGRYSLLATFNDVYHGKLRKMFNYGLSNRALKSQEHLIRSNVVKLTRSVNQSLASDPNAPIDFVRVFNCITFDSTRISVIQHESTPRRLFRYFSKPFTSSNLWLIK